jgi:hypothetical protein
MFCVHILWHVQDVPDTCKTPSVVLCAAFLLFQEWRKEAKEKIRGVKVAFQQVGW